MPRIAALLVAVLAIGHAQLVMACAGTSGPMQSQRGPCCPAEAQQVPDVAAMHVGCESTSERNRDCAAILDLVPTQPAVAGGLSMGEPEGGTDDGQPPLPVWPTPPVTAHLRPPPVGPPAGHAAALPGTRTYLATLRLRI